MSANPVARPTVLREPGEHKVTFTVTIAKAMSISAVGNESPVIESNKKGKKLLAVYDSPKAQNYFHLEYKLFPSDLEPVKTDIVVYGMAAKIYNENDSKVLKTWREGDNIWIAWVQSVSVWVNKDLLYKLFEHTLELRIWDSKDKVSTRARFDRPKAFRLLAEDGEADIESTNVKALVVNQSLSYMQLQPKESDEQSGESDMRRVSKTASGVSRGVEQQKSDENRATTAPGGCTTTPAPSTSISRLNELAKVQVNVLPGRGSYYSSLAELAGINQPLSEADIGLMAEMEENKKREGFDRERRKKKLQVDELEKETSRPIQSMKTRKRSKKEEQKLAAINLYTRSHGIAAIQLHMSLLFAGTTSVTKRLPHPIFGIEDLLLTVSLDKSLLSDEQKKELNPMVIKLCSASDLPNKPMSFGELHEKCQPVFAQYKFYKQPMHRTTGLRHARNIVWDDINVVLLGALDKGCLEEYLQGPAMEIEIHDRDRKIDPKKTKSELFGHNPEDEMISNISLVAGRRTTHNPFESKQNAWNPYGIAKIDLGELLLGHRYIYLTVPVRTRPTPDPTIGHERPGGSVLGHPGSVDGPEEEPIGAANYIEAGCELKVKIEVVHPLATPAEVQKRMQEPSEFPLPYECPFARVICIFDYNNTNFLRDIQNEISKINAQALELTNLPEHVIEAALSTYKLSDEQKLSKNLDILTGFQVIDGVRHIFVLEGLRNEGVKQLMPSLSISENRENQSLKVLYKSDMMFSERLYASLDVDFCRVRLHDSLTNITEKPLLYVRDIVPRPCFEGLSRLDKILQATKLREVVKNDLFPTCEMITSISREFGVPLTAEDFGETDAGDRSLLLDDLTVDTSQYSKTKRQWTPLELKNSEYLLALKNRENTKRNFLTENILKTGTKQRKPKSPTVAVDKDDIPNQVVHNYSSQTLNSTELSKRKLREILRKDTDSLYTYCPEYNSASVVTQDVILDSKKSKEAKDKEKWLTSEGFIYPGSITALKSNRHLCQPDSARVAELHKPWRENVLHSNILKPTVETRDVFPWKYRNRDMDLVKQPADQKYQSTIHLHGEAREQELRDVNENEKIKWQSRLVVDDLRFKTHRCLPSTELTDKGKNALSKLQDILKDSPEKYSLKAPSLRLDKIPPLTTATLPGKDTVPEKEAIENRGCVPGPFLEKRWVMEGNRIPVRSEEKSTPYENDFRLVYHEKSVTSQRPIAALLASEKNTHLFQTLTGDCPITSRYP